MKRMLVGAAVALTTLAAAGGAIVMVAWPRDTIEAQPAIGAPNPYFLP